MQNDHAPQTAPQTVQDRDKLQQRRFALIVGLIAFFLPIILLVGPEIGNACNRYSISHFYYSPFWGGIFIGLLAFIGTYMIAYDSLDWDERWGATIGGICAFGVAFLPTGGHGCLLQGGGTFRARAFAHFDVDTAGQHILRPPVVPNGDIPLQSDSFFTLLALELPFGLKFSQLHYVAAIGLFLVLLYFCFVIFQRTSDRHLQKGSTKTTPIKKLRNLIYYSCGFIILLSMIYLGAEFLSHEENKTINTQWNRDRNTFRYEAYALMAFGISWMVKGRFVPWLVDEKERPS